MKFSFFKKKVKPQDPIVVEKNADDFEDFEICINCGKQTNVLKSTPIELRKGFISGCGQLCSHCNRTMELENHDPDFRASSKEMFSLLSACSENQE